MSFEPVCTRCQTKGQTCLYSGSTATTINIDQKASHDIDSHIYMSSTTQSPITKSPLSSSEHLIKVQSPEKDSPLASEQHNDHYTAHGPFTAQVAAAIAAKAGVEPQATLTNQVPFVDAPLFGEMDLDCLHSAASAFNPPEIHLPPRAYADRLVGIYWQHVYPVEPILDREHFLCGYNGLYLLSREELSRPDHSIWLSMLYVVLAAAIQVQEATALQRRNEEANGYFQIAWQLLRPEAILWKPGSLELVQCLMLINRYLHCTNSQHKTWMTIGIAMRMAQSIGCHLPETLLAKCSENDRQLKKKVWVNCLALDR